MELVLREEGEPIDALLLVLPELGLDGHGNIVLLHLAAVQQLHQEFTFFIATLQEFLGEAKGVG